MVTVHGLAARRFAEDARSRCPVHASLALPYPPFDSAPAVDPTEPRQ